MTGPLWVGVIGAGWIADTHRRNLEEVGGAVIAAVADPDVERARLLAAPSGAETFADWDGLLAGAEVEAVLVCTPPALHREPALAAFRRGVAVYLEKPIARSSTCPPPAAWSTNQPRPAVGPTPRDTSSPGRASATSRWSAGRKPSARYW